MSDLKSEHRKNPVRFPPMPGFFGSFLVIHSSPRAQFSHFGFSSFNSSILFNHPARLVSAPSQPRVNWVRLQSSARLEPLTPGSLSVRGRFLRHPHARFLSTFPTVRYLPLRRCWLPDQRKVLAVSYAAPARCWTGVTSRIRLTSARMPWRWWWSFASPSSGAITHGKPVSPAALAPAPLSSLSAKT